MFFESNLRRVELSPRFNLQESNFVELGTPPNGKEAEEDSDIVK